MTRRTAVGDSTLFVTRPPRRRYDTNLARLIKAALTRYVSLAGLATLPLLPSADDVRKTSAWEEASNAHRLAHEGLQAAKLRGVKLISRATPATTSAIERRRPEMRVVREFLDLCQLVLDQRSPSALLGVLEQQFLRPARPDTIFELQVGFRILAYLRSVGYDWDRNPTLLERREPFSEMRNRSTGERVTVWWQRPIWQLLPDEERRGLLRTTLRAGGMQQAAFIPDFILRIGEDRFRLIEIKHTVSTEPADERGGIQEMFAYLLDADELFGGEHAAHALVVAWNGTGRPHPCRVVVTDQNNIEDALALLLR